MATLGNVEHFNPNNPGAWDAYKERVELFLKANNITEDDRKQAVFLNICGAATYDILRSLISPAKVSDASYENVIKTLSAHFSPGTSEIVARFKFYRRNQQVGETISVYVKELRKLAEECGFGSSLDTMLRDRLVCGVNHEALQKRLLAESKITFKKGLEMRVAHEVAAEGIAVLKQTQADGAKNVNTINSSKPY
ncbi:uncharacterized protein [Onthophagus taurus]|uniref:uncharacterized protein n=1 Tax=Onthophagus taurus TaxID=166361 RepID=UPI0039BEAFBC